MEQDVAVTSSGRVDFCQNGRWNRGPVIPTAGELQAVLIARVDLALAVGAERMRVVAPPPGERTFVAELWSPAKGGETARLRAPLNSNDRSANGPNVPVWSRQVQRRH